MLADGWASCLWRSRVRQASPSHLRTGAPTGRIRHYPHPPTPFPHPLTPRVHCRRRWGAFALALVLSLGSAVPIVYLCRLPECIKALAGGGD